METLLGTWSYPTTIHLGAGRFSELAMHCASLEMKRPLLVTDAGLAENPMIKQALDLLAQAGLKAAVFAQVQGNPVIGNLEMGVEIFKSGDHDGTLAIGGGSALDIGKLVALMAHQTVSVWDLEDIGDWWKRAQSDVIAPIIAIPTTAGTGSEVGRAAVLTNDITAEKKIIFHPKMLPSVVICDPELAVGLPAGLTATTGLDAFTHSLETFCVDQFHPMADAIALESLRLVKTFLPRAFRDGKDLEARTMMCAAALMGGVAFQKGLGATHSIAHALGAIYDIHHGLANAVVLPYVLLFNRSKIEEKSARVAETLAIDGGFDGLLAWMLEFRKELKIAHTLGELGVDLSKIDEIAVKAQADPSTGTNPRETTPDDMGRIFQAAVEGDLHFV